MRKTIILAASLLASTAVFASTDRDALAETLRQMIGRYPEAAHRMEYRVMANGDDAADCETRYDFRMRRDAMDATDVDALKKSCLDVWKAANPTSDRMMMNAFGDSLSYTLVFDVSHPLPRVGSRTEATRAFWGNGGFMLFDLGEYVSVTFDNVVPSAYSPLTPDLSPLKATFEKLSHGREVESKPVRYSGNKGSFVFQRGDGKGWTHGVRHTIKGVSQADYSRLLNSFKHYIGSGQAVDMITRNGEMMIKSEAGPEFLIASIDSDRTLHYLNATVDNQICIPKGWETTDFYNNGATDYTDMSSLDQLYDSLAALDGAVAADVSYTGSFLKGHPGFEWQRGDGNGLTLGRRITLRALPTQTVESVLDTFRSLGAHPSVNMRDGHRVSTFENGTRTFYGFSTDTAGMAYFLRAVAEDEVCVPIDWTTRDYFKGSGPGYMAQASERTRRIAGLSRLWAGVRRNFAFMDRIKFNWDSLYVSMIPRIEAARDDYEATRLLQEMAARLGDGHTAVYYQGVMGGVPVDTRRIDGGVYITRVYDPELEKLGLRCGQRITAIDGTDVDEYVARNVMPYVSSSTPQWTEHVCYESPSLLLRRPGDNMRLTLDDGGRVFDVDVAPGNISGSGRDLSFSTLDNKIGYLRIASFNSSSVTEMFDSVYPAIMRTSALVIDLRGNGGGNSGYADYILRHLTTSPIPKSSWRSPLYIPAYASWGRGEMWHESPADTIMPFTDRTIYDRPVALLVDNATFSAAEDFCAAFRSMKRGLLIGRPTGGSTGNGVRIELIPRQAWANICSKHDTAADGTEFVGHGFEPDIKVDESYESLFVNERDNTLTEALRVLSRSGRR